MEKLPDANDGQSSPASGKSSSPADFAGVASDLSQRLVTTASKIAAGHQRSNSFQRWKRHMQRAWKWGGASREHSPKVHFNPELLANQKRQWYKLHSRLQV